MNKFKHTPGPWEYYNEEQKLPNGSLFFHTVRRVENKINLVRLHDEALEACKKMTVRDL